MKTNSFIVSTTLALLAMGGVQAESNKAQKNVLIAYFSKTGNTERAAMEIQKNAGGDLFEIRTITPYPADYTATTQAAKKEQSANARPELTSKVTNMNSYDVIFLGYPVWWGTMPMAVFTFLEAYDLSGKTIIPFCTHEGSSFGHSVSDLKKECPHSIIFEGIAIRGHDAKNSQNTVSEWIKNLNLAKKSR